MNDETLMMIAFIAGMFVIAYCVGLLKSLYWWVYRTLIIPIDKYVRGREDE